MMKINLSIKEIVLLCVWIICVVLMLYLQRGLFLTAEQEDYNDASSVFYEVDLSETKLTQSLQLKSAVEKFAFLIVNHSDENQELTMSILDSVDQGMVKQVQVVVPANGGTEQVVEWNFDKKEELPSQIILEVSQTNVENSVHMCVQGKSFEQTYMENGEVMDAHIRMSVIYSQWYNWGLIIVCAFSLMLAGFIFILKDIQRMKIETLFIIVAFLLGAVFAFINPFGQEPDGWVHFTRSMDVAQGNLLLPFVDNNDNGASFLVPENINDIGFRKINPNGAEGRAYMDNIKSLYFSDDIVEMSGLAGFTSMFYYPQAIGIFIASLFGLSAYGYMVCGRIVNLVAYIFLAYLGLKKMPLYRNIYMVIALLPMTLYQAASFSYDAILNGLCFLFIGLCFYYAYEKEQLSWKDVLKLGIILALLLMCKYVYVCIGLLVFIIPMKKFGMAKDYWKAFGIALIPIVLQVAYMLLSSRVPDVSVNTLGTSNSTHITQFGYVLQNPVYAVKVFINTIVLYFGIYVEQLNTLGWLNYTLGMLEFLVPIFMMVVAVLDTNGCEQKVTNKDRMITFGAFAVVVSMGMIGLYLFDPIANPVGAPTIQGYQGRYTIPVLMLLLATFSSRNVENRIKNFSYKVVGIMTLVLSYTSFILLNKCY